MTLPGKFILTVAVVACAGAIATWTTMKGVVSSPGSAKDSPRATITAERHGTAAAQVTPQDTSELLAQLQALTTQDGQLDFQALQAAISELVRRDPRGAAAFAFGLPPGTAREIALHRVAQAWAEKDPAAAEQWADGIHNQDERGMLLQEVCVAAAAADPARAMQMADDKDLFNLSPGMAGNLVQQWAMRDYDAALKWAAAQPEGAARDQSYLRLALVRSQTAPEEAARLISENVAAQEIQEEAAITIVSRWAATDPRAAEEWARSFAADDLRDRALKEVRIAVQASAGAH